MSQIRLLLGLDQVRIAVSGAAPVAPEILTFMLALGIPVCEVGDVGGACIAPFSPPGQTRIGTVGKAIPGVQLKLAGDGKLLLRGPIVMKGYRHDPAATAGAIDPGGWLHTGDLAAIDADGYVTITGRKKDLIINAAAKNISPANIEGAVLAASPLIAYAVAAGDRRPYLVALIVLDPDAAATFAAQPASPTPPPPSWPITRPSAPRSARRSRPPTASCPGWSRSSGSPSCQSPGIPAVARSPPP